MNELHETCKRWDEVAASVPEVVERLHTLRSLHEQGAQFGKSMTHIDTVQQQLRDQLATQTVTLNTVRGVAPSSLPTFHRSSCHVLPRCANAPDAWTLRCFLVLPALTMGNRRSKSRSRRTSLRSRPTLHPSTSGWLLCRQSFPSRVPCERGQGGRAVHVTLATSLNPRHTFNIVCRWCHKSSAWCHKRSLTW